VTDDDRDTDRIPPPTDAGDVVAEQLGAVLRALAEQTGTIRRLADELLSLRQVLSLRPCLGEAGLEPTVPDGCLRLVTPPNGR
jgi:DNA-binding transcriptional LysR family regulator